MPWSCGAPVSSILPSSCSSRASVAAGYLIGAVLMIAAAAVEARWGVAAERKPLEAVSQPLALID